MALIKCKECEKEISSNATICPNCGYKNTNEKEKASFDVLLLCFLIPVIGIIIFAINTADKPKYAEQCLKSSLLSFIVILVGTIIIARICM